jgi:hypothetical protein
MPQSYCDPRRESEENQLKCSVLLPAQSGTTIMTRNRYKMLLDSLLSKLAGRKGRKQLDDVCATGSD